jgi:sec-independent protein translocase protein TatA
MLGLRPTELLIIVFILLLLFGASRLPELASSVGKAMKDFRKAVNQPDEPAPPSVTATEAEKKTTTNS